MTRNDLILLILGATGLGLMGVIIDRLNFPQRKFRPKTIALKNSQPQHRDRTGAHITDFVPPEESPDVQ